MILHWMKPPHAHERERRRLRGMGRAPIVQINADAMHRDLVARNRVMVENVMPVEFGNREAESAILQFAIEVVSPNQQIGAMQGHTETNIEQTRGDHCAPGSKESVMNMNVFDVLLPQKHRQVSAKPCM